MIGLMNYNLSAREENGKSELAKIESAFLKSLSGGSLTEEQLEQIEAYLVTNPNLFDSPSMYSGLEQVGLEFQMLKQSTIKTQTEHYTL